MHMDAHRMHHKWTGHLEPLHAGARPGDNAQQQLPGVVAPVGDADLQGVAAWQHRGSHGDNTAQPHGGRLAEHGHHPLL